MTPPETRLFHLHYHVPDVDHAERVLAEKGLPLHARFGWVDDEMVALGPADEIPEGFRFRLQDSQRGYANVTLTSGKRMQFDHLGIYTTEFESVIDSAEEAGWNVHGIEEPRTFLITPWKFRIEVHREGDRVEDSLGSWEDAHFSEIILTVSNADAVREGLTTVIGDIPGLVVHEEPRGPPHVPQATVSGTVFPEERTIEAHLLESSE